MTVVHLTDRCAVGGGTEYIRLLCNGMPDVDSRVLYAVDGNCRASVVNRLKPDVIHVSHLKALSQLYATPFQRPRARVVFTVHGVHLQKFDFLPRSVVNVAKRFLRWKLERCLYRKVDAIIALTEADRDLVLKLYGGDLPVHVVPNGIDFGTATATGSREYDYISIARFCLQKGQRVLVEAVARAQDAMRERGSKVLMVGAGEDFQLIREIVARRGVSDLIAFAGEVRDGANWLPRARALVAPSLWEGFPFLLLEAAAQGMLVVASDCHGHVELIRDGETGRLFHVNDVDALSDILKAGIDGNALAMGRRFQAEMREAHPLETMLEETRGIYRKLLSGGNGGQV